MRTLHIRGHQVGDPASHAMPRGFGGSGVSDILKWLAPLSLFAFASWHVLMMHQETQQETGPGCPPRVKCIPEEPLEASSNGAPPGNLRALAAEVPSGTPCPTKPKAAIGEGRPTYDVVMLIMSTGSKNDRKRMDVADKTWLKKSTPNMTFTYFYALCHDEPAVKNCESGDPGCIRDRHAVRVLPCKHGYQYLTSKSIEGYRYIAATFEYKYVFKVDVDSLLDLSCLETSILNLPATCSSFGMGLWRVAGDSKVFAGGGSKYDNHAYADDTGADAYPPYMTGWAMLWSADVARFLGSAGLPNMPKFRQTWTIDDAAIGTFVLGLDMCHLRMTCSVWTEQSGDEMEKTWMLLHDTDKVAKIGDGGAVQGYSGPFDDDVPNLGDLYNLQSASLGHCATLCTSNPQCRSFEFSPTAGAKWDEPVKNCQIASGTNRAGKQWRNFVLYLKK